MGYSSLTRVYRKLDATREALRLFMFSDVLLLQPCQPQLSSYAQSCPDGWEENKSCIASADLVQQDG